MYEQTNPENRTATLEDYLKAIRNHAMVVAGLVVCGLLVALWLQSERDATYESDTAVALGPTPVGSTNANLEAPSVERESEILASRNVAEGVIGRLDLELSAAELLASVDVKFVPNSDVLQVKVSGSDADQVSAVANAIVEEYAAQREAAAEDFYQEDLSVKSEQLALAEVEVERISAELQLLTDARQELVDDGDPTASIDNQISTLRTEQNIALGVEREARGLLDAGNRAQVTRTPTAEVIRLSEPATSPAGIPSGLFPLAGLLAGLILGVAVAFIIDRLDNTAKDERALSLALGSRVMGEIPSFGLVNRGGSASLVMLSESQNSRTHRAQESIRRLRSAVQFLVPSMGRDGALVFAVSSAYPGEGKSTTSANLSIALAQAGAQVVLVSADFRRPTLEGMFDVNAESGLTSLLGGVCTTIKLEPSGVDNLRIVPAGPPAKNPSELLGAALFDLVVEELRADSDFVIFDTPPVLSTADALVVGPKMDGMLIVVDSRTTDTDDLLRVRAELDRSGTTLLGGVLNRDRRKGRTWFRRDRYSYSRRPTPPSF